MTQLELNEINYINRGRIPTSSCFFSLNIHFISNLQTINMPRFKQVDVFTNVKYLGNPVAVIYDSDNLTTQEMQKLLDGQIYQKQHLY